MKWCRNTQRKKNCYIQLCQINTSWELSSFYTNDLFPGNGNDSSYIFVVDGGGRCILDDDCCYWRDSSSFLLFTQVCTKHLPSLVYFEYLYWPNIFPNVLNIHLSKFSLIGVQADQMVLRGLVPSCLPEVDTLLQVSLS